MFNNMIKYKFILSLIFVSFLINKEALAIVTKSTGDVKYKNYLNNEFSSELKMGSQLFNNDLIVNIQDVILVISFILGNNEPTTQEFINSDLNGDNQINILDIIMIVDIIFNN